MKFREMVKRVQKYSGYSYEESKQALEHMVESIAVRLSDSERKDFASQLPGQLKAIALTVRSTAYNTKTDLIQDFIDIQKIDADHAKKQIKSAWQTIKEAITPLEIKQIKSQLPTETLSALN